MKTEKFYVMGRFNESDDEDEPSKDEEDEDSDDDFGEE